MSQKSSDPAKHWLRPLKGNWRAQTHALLYPLETMRRGRVTSDNVQGHILRLLPDGQVESVRGEDAELHDIDGFMEEATRFKGETTIWLPSGWDHLVLTGLAALMDKGAITWRYCSLDTHRLLIRGMWRGKPIVITSLANWTGGTWDSWRDKVPERGFELFRQSWLGCCWLSKNLQLGRLPPSASSAGLLFWRSVLGPRVKIRPESAVKRSKARKQKPQEYVAPIPQRPEQARHAERHCCYGLCLRQMRRGLVPGPIYCVDLTSAYLLFLATTPLPVLYDRQLHRPKPEELVDKLVGHTGCALVQIRSGDCPYPVRRGNRIAWATGEYWSWLAGAELAWALLHHQVQQVETAHLWLAANLPAGCLDKLLWTGQHLKDQGRTLAAAAWRSLYSQLVGRFAAWRREWKDCKAPHSFGRWAAWLGADPETGNIVSYRSIAGRIQKLTGKTDTSDSVPLLFAAVTAQGRYITTQLADHAGREEVIAIDADAVWVTQRGWQNLLKRVSEVGLAPDNLGCKEVYERAWMSGKRIALVEMNGEQYMRCPGIPADIAVGAKAEIAWPEGGGWGSEGEVNPHKGVRRHVRRYDAKRVRIEYGGPEIRLPFAEEIIDPVLSASLLQPLNGMEVKADEQE